MKRILWVALMVALGGCATVLSFSDSSVRQTVRLIASEGIGNGSVVVLKPGLLLTARHVADEIDNGNPLFIEPQHIKAKVLRKSKNHDVALLEAPGVNCPCAELADEEPQLDDVITIVGYPLNSSVVFQVLTQGRLQGINQGKMVHAVNAAPGNSGGGVFKDGKLVGILIEGYREFSYLTASVRLKVIKEFING